jgi:sugar phosphate isomerase/epimerase
MTVESAIRIGNQTAFSAIDFMEPFNYAISNGFKTFEWFPDKNESGTGWVENDVDDSQRNYIKETALTYDCQLTVHAPKWANPFSANVHQTMADCIRFANDIGAKLLNIHLHTEKGLENYVDAIAPIIVNTSNAGIKLSIENTPSTTPLDFNLLFTLINDRTDMETSHVGMCLDIGHANLCLMTHNEYIKYLNLLDAQVPIIHLHLHENYGDRDSHLTIFTGPSADNDTGIRTLLEILIKRGFSGSIIMEQWPEPKTVLNQAYTRIKRMLSL